MPRFPLFLLVLVLSALLVVPAVAAADASQDLGLRYGPGTQYDVLLRGDPVSGDGSVQPAPRFKVEIEGVTQGAFLVSGSGLTARIVGLPDPGGPPSRIADLDMVQDLDLALELPRNVFPTEPTALTVRGSASARLQSRITDATVTWQPRVTAYGQCWVFAAVRTDSPVCVEFRVSQELDGPISGFQGRGTCGSMRQTVRYSLVRSLEGNWTFGGFIAPAGTTQDGSGALSLANEACQDAILGVMPGDNITLRGQQNARVIVEGLVTGRQGRLTIATVRFEGRLANGLPIRGEGEVRIQGDPDRPIIPGRQGADGEGATLSGNVQFRALVGEGSAARVVETQGRLSLIDVTGGMGGTANAFDARGTLQFNGGHVEEDIFY